MQYYHDIITKKSQEYLRELSKKHDFILIGGWAVFLYTRALKSKDIDVIVDYQELSRLKEAYDIAKNDRLKKYEFKAGEFDVDIYLEHYSKLGVAIGDVKANTKNISGFKVPVLEYLFLLKLYAWQNRRGSAKGQKDELDIFSLAILPDFDWPLYPRLVEKFGFQEYSRSFASLLKRTRSIKELSVNEQRMAKFRRIALSGING